MKPPPPWLISRWFFVTAVLLGNLIFWAIPSRVVELVARQEQVLLGLYSRRKLAWMLGVAVLSAIAAYIRCAPTPALVRRRAFQVAAAALALGPTLLVADVLLRLRTDYPYMADQAVYHRPPGKVYTLPFEDVPEARRSYPNRAPGYGRVECVMSYDDRGYRNRAAPPACDVVALGDSFTEGSRVSDDQAWPVQLERLSGRSVYNLGISGYNPPEYLASLRAYGLPLRPRLVLCMLYEGNDFRSTNLTARSGVTFRQVVATSPLLLGLDHVIVRAGGAVGAGWNFPGLDLLSWLPVCVPNGPAGRYYAFEPKQILELNVSRDDFSASEPWFAMKGILREMADACAAAGARLVILYAPNKAHAVFPLAAPALPAEKVHAFAALRAKKGTLPEAGRFIPEVLGNLENRERVIAAWCASRSIPFLSLTPAIREATAAGRQTYYTYDQHWTPLGHEAAARAIAAYCEKLTAPRVAAGAEEDAPPPGRSSAP
jgi:hypothetical protein